MNVHLSIEEIVKTYNVFNLNIAGLANPIGYPAVLLSVLRYRCNIIRLGFFLGYPLLLSFIYSIWIDGSFLLDFMSNLRVSLFIFLVLSFRGFYASTLFIIALLICSLIFSYLSYYIGCSFFGLSFSENIAAAISILFVMIVRQQSSLFCFIVGYLLALFLCILLGSRLGIITLFFVLIESFVSKCVIGFVSLMLIGVVATFWNEFLLLTKEYEVTEIIMKAVDAQNVGPGSILQRTYAIVMAIRNMISIEDIYYGGTLSPDIMGQNFPSGGRPHGILPIIFIDYGMFALPLFLFFKNMKKRFLISLFLVGFMPSSGVLVNPLFAFALANVLFNQGACNGKNRVIR